MIEIKHVLKAGGTARVAVAVCCISGATSLRGDDPVPPIAIVPNEAAKGGTVMEGTLPPPRKTSTKPDSSTAKPASNAGKEDGAARVDRPRLGLNVHAERAVINKVYPDSGAAAAGVQAGGQIIAIDGQPVKNTADLKRVIRERTSRDTVTLQVVYGMSTNPRGSATQTPWTKTFRVPLGKPKMIFLELPAPVKEK
ncbi:PDZ domain-containing protein [Novipirellula sp.]|uniref:PDZ domain-containing protein n=1 Tax=Novipirellula sp. TaxID=2795430 RepID=UPI003567921B